MDHDLKLLDQVLSHKKWVVRKRANQCIASICGDIEDPKDPLINLLRPRLKNALEDTSSNVVLSALQALIAYLRAAKSEARCFAKEVCEVMATRCLIYYHKKGELTRLENMVIENAKTAFMSWVELGASKDFLDAMDNVVKRNDNSVLLAIDVIAKAFRVFGEEDIPRHRIVDMIKPLLLCKNQKIVEASKHFIEELEKGLPNMTGNQEKELAPHDVTKTKTAFAVDVSKQRTGDGSRIRSRLSEVLHQYFDFSSLNSKSSEDSNSEC